MNEFDRALCFLCHNPLKNPLKTTCQHVFCQKCILKWLTENLMCPCNCGILFTTELTKINDLQSVSESLHFKCPNYQNGCRKIIMRKEFKQHLKNECKFPRNISMNSQNSTSKSPNIENAVFFNAFLENFLDKLQINNCIQPQIDVINEILQLIIFVDTLRASQIKIFDLTFELAKKDSRSMPPDFAEIKQNLSKMDLKPLSSHLLSISEKIKVYLENAKVIQPKINKEKAQSSKVPLNKQFIIEPNPLKIELPEERGFLTSHRKEGFFSKTMKFQKEKNQKTFFKKTPSQTNQNQPNNQTQEQIKLPKNPPKSSKKNESLEEAKQRLLLQKTRLFQLTHTHGVLSELTTPENGINVESTKSRVLPIDKHYRINHSNNLTNNFNKASKRSLNSTKNITPNKNSIRKALIDLTSNKYRNQDSPYSLSIKSKMSPMKKERKSNRFQRSNCSIKNTTSSSSGSKKAESNKYDLADINTSEIRLNDKREETNPNKQLYLPYESIRVNPPSNFLQTTQNNTNITCPSFLTPTHITSINEKSDSLNITSGAENRNSYDISATEISSKSFFGSPNQPSAFQQKMIIKNLMRKDFGEEKTFYPKADVGKLNEAKFLINAKWWRSWIEYVGFASSNDILSDPLYCEDKGFSNKKPGFINNKELLKTDLNNNPVKFLRENLLEHHDFEAVSKEIYKNLKKWYNVDIDIIRFLKTDPLINNKLYLDIYPEKRKKNSNQNEPHHSKRNGWSIDIPNFSSIPKQMMSYSRNNEDVHEGSEIFGQVKKKSKSSDKSGNCAIQ